MKASVLNALDRVASLSAETAALVNQIKPKNNPEGLLSNPEDTVAKLTNKITQLNSEIVMLRMMTLPVEEPLTEDEVEAFTHSFYDHLERLEDVKVAMLGFNRSFFLAYSPRVRIVIATALLNYCTKQNLTVSDLWRDIVANMGHF